MALPSSKLVLMTITLLSIAALSNMPSTEAILGANTVIITGTAFCPLTSVLGVPSPIVRVVGATVNLVCGVSPAARVLGTAVTNLAGDIAIVLGLSQTLAFDPNACRLEVRVPPGLCSIPLVNNILPLPLRLVNLVPVTINGVTGTAFIVVSRNFPL